MMREPNKRPRRNPLTSEEVSQIIAHKKKRELLTLQKLKQSGLYKVLNVFNICCIFIYLELLLCYFGPSHYQRHYSFNTVTNFGSSYIQNRPIISDIDVYGVNGVVYKFIVEDFIDVPGKRISFVIGKDFLLQKELKGVLESSNNSYRLFSASPVLLLCVLVTLISFFAFMANLNENAFSLRALTTLNILVLLGIFAV